jgi:hypothetical protein
MKGDINPAFEQALEEVGRHTTPEALRQKGVRNLLSVGKADVSRLIEISVNRTLMARTIGGLSDEDKRYVIDAAQEVFDDQMRGMQALEVSRRTVEKDKAEIQAELAQLKRELAPKPGFEEAREKEVSGEDLKKLRLRIQARLLPIFDRLPPGGPTLRGTALELLALFVQERDDAVARYRDDMTGRVAQLERRIAKLMKSLEETESVLNRVSAMKDLEIGIESMYRTVQGLGTEESDRERKLEMMKNIFEANLEMQHQNGG